MRPPTKRSMSMLAGAALGLTGCTSIGFLDPAGPVAEAQRLHFWLVCAVMLFVAVPIFTVLPFLLWRYRYRDGKNNADYAPDWNRSLRWELALWGGPVVVVGVLAVMLWHGTHRLDPWRPLPGQAVQVQVVAQDWRWLFIYPEYGVATVDRLVLPAGRPAALRLTSASVMQSFHVPALAGQIYAMYGMTTQLHLQADHPGEWMGRNTQYNGAGFYQQDFTAVALDEDAFAAWVRSAQGAPAMTDPVLEMRGGGKDLAERLGRDPDDLVFGAVPDGVFEQVAGHAHHGGS